MASAAEGGHVEAWDALIAAEANFEALTKKKENALMLAAGSGNVSLVNKIVNMYPIEAKARDGRTALLYAAEGGSVEVWDELIGKGAELSSFNYESALKLAVGSGNAVLVHKLLIMDKKLNQRRVC